MTYQKDKEKLFKIIEFNYLSLISSLVYDCYLNRVDKNLFYSKLVNFETTDTSIDAPKELQIKALEHRPSLARFCIGCAYRETFSAIRESIKDANFLKELEIELNDNNKSFDGMIRFLRNSWSHQTNLIEITNIKVNCQDQKIWNLKNRQGLPLSIIVNNNTIDIDLNNVQDQDKLLTILDLKKQQIIIDWIYNYLKP